MGAFSPPGAVQGEEGEFGTQMGASLRSLVPARELTGLSAEGRIAAWLGGVSAVVLVIAIANVCHFQLFRALRRRRDTALRAALGASRGRLLSGSLIESLVLAAAAGGIGLIVAAWGGGLLRLALLPASAAPAASVGPRVALVCFLLVLLSGMTAGLLPVLSALRRTLVTLRSDGGSTTPGRSRLQAVVLAAQTALSVVLVVCAALFIRSLNEVVTQDLGFTADRVILASLEFADGTGIEQQDSAYLRLLEAIRGLPMVETAVPVGSTPFGKHLVSPVGIPGKDSEELFPGQLPQSYKAAPDYFPLMGLELIEGRLLNVRDGEGSPLVVVVNEALARHLWPASGPIGQCLRVGMDPDSWPPSVTANVACREVVGVVSNTRTQRIREEEENTSHQYYIPFGQPPSGFGPMLAQMPKISDLLILVDREPEDAVSELKQSTAAVVGADQFLSLRPFQELLDPQIRPFRLGAALFSALGLLALLMAAFGLYGILSYSVARRQREIGIRMAIGATGRRVTRLVLGETGGLVIAGGIAGTIGALAAGRLLASQLYRTAPYDPLALTTAFLVLLTAAAAACVLPAWRASRTDPAVVLRED